MSDDQRIEAPLHERLNALGIESTTHRHAPLHTVEQSKALVGRLPGVHIKNMFLRDKKRRMWLVTVHEDQAVDMKALRHKLGASGSLSFGNAELLRTTLGVDPGAVTPFAVMNDREGQVQAVVDRAILAGPVVNAHPLHNAATIAIAPDDLLRFLADCDHPPLLVAFDALT